MTADEILLLAQKAQWNVDCLLRPPGNRLVRPNGDFVVITGDGVDDLDRLLGLMATYPNGDFKFDVGSIEPSYRYATVADVQALRAAYVALWGTVSKPPPMEDFYNSVAVQVR